MNRRSHDRNLASGGWVHWPSLAAVRDLVLVAALVVVGSLKLVAALMDSMIDLRTGWPHGAIWIAGCVELVAAVLLFYLWRVNLKRTARLVQASILSLFLLATGWQVAFGTASSCPCFGSAEIPKVYVVPTLLGLLLSVFTPYHLDGHPPLRAEVQRITEVSIDRCGIIAPVLVGMLSVGALLSPSIRGACFRMIGIQSVHSDPMDVDGLEAGKRTASWPRCTTGRRIGLRSSVQKVHVGAFRWVNPDS